MNEVEEYVVREQDSLIFREHKALEIMGACKNGSFDIGSFSIFIGKHLHLIPRISTNNLLLIYFEDKDEEYKKALEDELKSRFHKGEKIGAGNKIVCRIFGECELNAICFFRLNQIIGIKDKLENEYRPALKRENPKAFNFISRSKKCLTWLDFLDKLDRGIITDEKLDTLEAIIGQNPHIIDTINYGLAQDDILSMDFRFVSRVARYKDEQTELMIIHDNDSKLFEMLSRKIHEWESSLSEREIRNLEHYVLINCAVHIEDMHNLQEDEIDNVVDFCILKASGGPINFKYEKDFKKKVEKDCDKVFYESQLRGKRFEAYSIKHLGMSFTNLQQIYNRKFARIDLTALEDDRIKQYVNEIRFLVECYEEDTSESMERLTARYNSFQTRYSPSFALHAEEVANQQILKSYEKAFRETSDKLSVADFEYEEFEGKRVKIIKLGKGFGAYSLVVRSTDTGFKVDKILENGSIRIEEMQNPSPNVDLKSSTFINEDFNGVAPLGENGCYFVFLNNNSNNMGEIGNQDINSNVADYLVTSSKGVSYLHDNLTPNCRKIYAEATVFERNPDYIMVFSDCTDIQKANSIKAASEYDIPIIYFNKDEIVKEQVSRLDDLLADFQNTGNLETLRTLISKYETNIAGWLLNREKGAVDESYTSGIDNDKYSPIFEALETKIYTAIANYCDTQSKQNHLHKIEKVAQILQEEIAKYEELKDNKVLTNVRMKFRASELLQILNKRYSIGLKLKENPLDTFQDLEEMFSPSFLEVVQETLSQERPDTTELHVTGTQLLNTRKEITNEDN